MTGRGLSKFRSVHPLFLLVVIFLVVVSGTLWVTCEIDAEHVVSCYFCGKDESVSGLCVPLERDGVGLSQNSGCTRYIVLNTNFYPTSMLGLEKFCFFWDPLGDWEHFVETV